MLYSLKLSRTLLADRNRPDVIEGRHEYANWLLQEANIHHPVFIDECGFKPARTQERARVEECAYRQLCGQKGRNITVFLAVSQVFCLKHHTIQMGETTRESFTDFIVGTATHLDEDETHYLIFDGAPAHRRQEQPTDNVQLHVYIASILTIPKYCREAISCLKACIKADISRPVMQERFADRYAARNAHLPLGEDRKQLLERAIRRNMTSITIPKCTAWFRHMQTYISRCLARENING